MSLLVSESDSFTDTYCILSARVYGVVVSMFDFTAAIGVRIPVVAVKFHHVYDYIIELHHWQVSENHKPRVHLSHVREIG